MFNGELVDNINSKHFADEPLIDLIDWSYAYKQYTLKHDFIKYPNGSNDYYHCIKQKVLHKKDVKTYLERADFDEVENRINHINDTQVQKKVNLRNRQNLLKDEKVND